MSMAEQVVVLWVAGNGHVDDIPLGQVRRFEQEFMAFVRERYADIIQQIASEKAISEESRREMEQAVTEFKAQFTA